MGERWEGHDVDAAHPGPGSAPPPAGPADGQAGVPAPGAAGPAGRRRLDRVLSPAYVADLAALPLRELQIRREEASREETELSFARRLLQGRLDILRALDEQRRSGAPQGSIVGRLTEILADDPGPSRTLGQVTVAGPALGPRRRLAERLIDDVGLADLDRLDDAALAAAIARLQVAEQAISDLRRQVQGVLEMLAAQIGARYLAGTVDPAEVVASRPAHAARTGPAG